MELTPEKLIEMLEKGEALPNVVLMYGEENYYRSKAAACIKKYVFGDASAEDMEISVFDRDTDLKKLNENIYNRITSVAKDLAKVAGEIEAEYGIPIVNKRISVTPIALIGGAACKTPEDFAEEFFIGNTEKTSCKLTTKGV